MCIRRLRPPNPSPYTALVYSLHIKILIKYSLKSLRGLNQWVASMCIRRLRPPNPSPYTALVYSLHIKILIKYSLKSLRGLNQNRLPVLRIL